MDTGYRFTKFRLRPSALTALATETAAPSSTADRPAGGMSGSVPELPTFVSTLIDLGMLLCRGKADFCSIS